MYVTEATLSNFRCLEALTVPFEHADGKIDFPRLTLLAGINGRGKTSILCGLAIGLMGWALEGYRSYYNVYRGADQAIIDIFVDPSSDDELALFDSDTEFTLAITSYDTIEKIADEEFPPELLPVMRDERDPRLFIAGYGASRQVETEAYDPGIRKQLGHARYRRVASLLLPHYTLVPFGSWLPKLDKKGRDKIGKIVNKLLPDDGLKFDPNAKNELYFYREKGKNLPFAVLSDGYKAFLGWVGDLLFHLQECSTGRTPIDEMPGIVLVDEIDLHLHPRWQQEVVGKLVRAFPKLQFILTTHSPLVVGSVQKSNVRVLHETMGVIEISTLEQEVRGLTSDQILLSPSFGLTAVREAEFMKELRKTEKLARAGDRRAALQFNQMVAYGAGSPPSDDDMPDWVREVITRKKRASGGKS